MLQTAHTFEHTPKKKKPVKPYSKGYYGNLKWYLQESNQGHTDFQSVALPTELRYLAKRMQIYVHFCYSQKKIIKFTEFVNSIFIDMLSNSQFFILNESLSYITPQFYFSNFI